MEDSNVNNLNGIGNFGHGMPEDGIVQAGITDIPTDTQPETMPEVDLPAEGDMEGMGEVEITNPEE